MKKFITPALAACLFLMIAGAKWATFDRFGSPMPDWDQWDAEARELFIPWFEHNHFAQHLFHPHNEHRVILTKLQNLALGLLNGQWDSRLEAVTNALLHTLLGVAFWLVVRRWVQAKWDTRSASQGDSAAASSMPALLGGGLFVMTAVLFGLPLAWQNVLGGFHSQQYWLLGLSFAAIVTLPFARTWRGVWWLGAASATLALGSMGSGFLAVAVVAVVVAWRIFRKDTTWRDAWPTLLLAVVLIAIGLLTRVEVAWHQKLKATSIRDFYFSIIHSMQWPMRERDWAAVVMWTPWAMVAWQIVRDGLRRTDRGGADGRPTASGETIVALGGWVLAQIAATAYARGAGADYPASRYMDTLAFGAMANVAALAWLLTDNPGSHARRGARVLVAVAWLATLGIGLWEVCDRNFRWELPDAKKYYIKAESIMARYLATNDPKQLASPDIPYPDAAELVERLSHPSLRALMPLPIRAPLALASASEDTGGFLKNDARGADRTNPPHVGLSPTTPPLEASESWGSFSTSGTATTGEWKSKPVESKLGAWLKFETAGDLAPTGGPAVGLSLLDTRTGKAIGEIRPSRTPGSTWRSAYVRAPRQAFTITAHDNSAQHWLGLSAPVEMGWLSYWAWRVSKNGLLLLYCAVAASLALGVFSWRTTRATPTPEGANVFLVGKPWFSRHSPESMKFFTPLALLVSALISVMAALPFLPAAKTQSDLFVLEARLSANTNGLFQIYYDDGTGFHEELSGHASVTPGDQPQVFRLPLPPGSYRALRVDPLERAGTVTLYSLRVLSPAGRSIADIPLRSLRPANQIETLRLRDQALEIVTTQNANDPQLDLVFNSPLFVQASWRDYTRGAFIPVASIFVALALVLFACDRAIFPRDSLIAWLRKLAAKPGSAVSLTAAVAVIASAYPVVFLGKSYVSPNLGTTLLYDEYPTLPGYTSSEVVDVKLSDVGAVMWQHVGFSAIQHRALAHGELPLWNRYNAAGVPLLAQGQSMFGDPLHLFVIAANGAAWAWDIKYLVAKWLFAAGLGLIVFALATPRPGSLVDSRFKSERPASGPALTAALVVAAAAPFIGFFLYRINHPAFFSLCYAPWPLYCLVRVAQAATGRQVALWCVGLIVSNLALMNSGTVKEAYMLLVCVNFSGACVLLAAELPWRERLARIGAVAWAGFTFTLITMPIWATFLQTLKNAYTGYNAASAYQIQPTLLLGLFDEIFYRPLMQRDQIFAPSLNFLLMIGLLYFAATLRTQFANRAAVALAASSLVPLSLAFGFVSPQWIVTLPFLGNIAHVDNTFSCVLIVLWSALAGIGFATAAQRLGTREGRDDLVIAGLLLLALVFGWVAFRQAAHRPILGDTFSVHKPGQVLPINPFIWNYLYALLGAVVVLTLAVRGAIVRRHCSAARGLLIAACAIVLLWRHSLHAATIGYEPFTARPTERVDFYAKSEAMEFMRAAHAREPARGFGLHGNFFPGWTGMYGLETVHGPDALVNKWLRELVGVSGVERFWDWRLYADASNVATARPFFDALNVRYYFDRRSDQGALGKALRLVKPADLDIYESPTVWPRAFFTDRIDFYDQPAELVAKFRTANGQPLAAAQRGDSDAQSALGRIPSDAATRTVAPATNYRLTENTTSFTVHASAPGVIVLTEALWPDDFRAEVNGRAAHVIRLNHAFKGVVVEAAGDYRVRFRYWPRNFPRNLTLCGFGMVLFAITLFQALRPERRESASR